MSPEQASASFAFRLTPVMKQQLLAIAEYGNSTPSSVVIEAIQTEIAYHLDTLPAEIERHRRLLSGLIKIARQAKGLTEETAIDFADLTEHELEAVSQLFRDGIDAGHIEGGAAAHSRVTEKYIFESMSRCRDRLAGQIRLADALGADAPAAD